MPILENSLCNIENKVKLEKEQQNKEKQKDGNYKEHKSITENNKKIDNIKPKVSYQIRLIKWIHPWQLSIKK